MSPLPTPHRAELLWGALFCAVLGTTWWAYQPGLAGPFIFDDFWNLRGLEQVARDDQPDALLQFTLGGIASKLGRPLSLLTFALQAHSWPANPEDFIRVNVLLHLLNACLLLWLLLRLQRLMGVQPRELLVPALAATSLWLLAPIQAGAVLYVVQRMAVLAGSCMLLGLLLYILGRDAMARGRPRTGLMLATAGSAVGMGLGVLAKENAGLFPLLVLATESLLLRGVPAPRTLRLWRHAFVTLPLLLLFAYSARILFVELMAPAMREFSPWERLLTETRVLWQYVHKLYMPSLYSLRLLYDDVQLSRSLLDPLTTAVAVTAWAALLTAAWHFRRAAPVFSFAVAWFVGNHLLESTVLPLEIAFEHRNYVASVGPLFALSWYAAALLRRVGDGARAALQVAAAAYLGLVLTALQQSADLWGRPLEQSLYWAATQPESARARHMLADSYLKAGFPDNAATVYREAMRKWPDDPAFPVGLYEIGCILPALQPPDASVIATSAQHLRKHALTTLNLLHRLLQAAEDGRCTRYSPAELWALVEALENAPAFGRQEQNLMLLRSRLAELAHERPNARLLLDHAIALDPKLPLLIQAIWWALAAGDVPAARRYLDIALHSPQVAPSERWTYREDLRRLEEEVHRASPRGAAQKPVGQTAAYGAR